MRRIVIVSLFLCAAAVAGAIAYWQRLPLVTVQAAIRGSVAEVVYATGVVEPVEWAKVVPIVRGRLVEVCNDCEGRAVKRGDVLARLDDSEARAHAREIEARLALSERTLERLTELRNRGVSTIESVDRAQAEVLQVRALLAAQRERIENLTLRSPQDGVVLRRDFQVGEVVSTSDVIAWVGRPRPLRIVAEVAEEDIGGVAPGLKVLLRHDAYRARVLAATVESITPKGDPVQKTFRVHLALPDDTPLRVGMSVEANIVIRERENALIVPTEAVRGDTVFMLDGEGRVVARRVSVGIRGTSGIEITGGLQEGDRLLAVIPPGLNGGDAVRQPDQGPVAFYRRMLWAS